jgi:glyoxylase-like metal-dependent hydrolase (beta-lactamase superfamily II)
MEDLMVRKLMSAVLLAAMMSLSAAAQNAETIIADASRAMGVTNLNSITFSGTAENVNFGQTRMASGPWPGTMINNYTRSIDFNQPASLARGTTAATPPGNYNQSITAANNVWTQQLEIFITPWGFLKGAATNPVTVNAQTIAGTAYLVVSWTPARLSPTGEGYKVNGYINSRNMVERVETWVEHPLLGDMRVEAVYSDYRDFGGVQVPARIVQSRGGFPTFQATITAATPNPANIGEVLPPPAPGGRGGRGGGGAAAGPGAARGATGAQPAGGQVPGGGGGQQQPPGWVQIAPGVWRLTGGYIALAIEFSDHIMVLEGPQNESRARAIITVAKAMIPNKPIRYVVNTHHHFDHSSGLAAFVAEGATIVTHESNRNFLQTALSNPRTLVGDSLARASRSPTFETVTDTRTFRDNTREVRLYHVENLEHADGMLIAYLPNERILFSADFALPQAGQQPNASLQTLAQNLDRLRLDFNSFVTVHAPTPDRVQTRADYVAAIGRQ